jgi:flagellar basal-body rod modification protein FlgD
MSSIGAVGATSNNLQSSNVSMQDFLNILLTQLSYQDPLKPMDNKEFMAQLAQFTTLGQTQELNGKIDALVSTQASMQSIGLLGKVVTFDVGQGAQKGEVQELSWAGTVPMLAIKTQGSGQVVSASLSQVSLIATSAAPQP